MTNTETAGAGAASDRPMQHDEALQRAGMVAIRMGREGDSQAAETVRAQIARIQALEADHQTLRTGYAAARLEIESLRARSVVPAVREAVAKAIYDQWVYKDGWVAWVHGGNSLRQDDARRLADLAFAMAQAAPAAVAGQSDDRVRECAARLVEHADFQLGGTLSADSKARDIPSRACSQVKARHLAALRDALAAAPTTQPAPQQEAQEPVAWQSRTRPTWGGNDRPWSPWEPCTKGMAEDCWKTPLLHDWAYEARALYTAPQPSPASQGDAQYWMELPPTTVNEDSVVERFGGIHSTVTTVAQQGAQGDALRHYEAALMAAFPQGASGDVFTHWNAARAAQEGK